MKHKGLDKQQSNESRLEIEENYLSKITSEVEAQNTRYFEHKTKELLLRAQLENDMFAKACASLLLQSSN